MISRKNIFRLKINSLFFSWQRFWKVYYDNVSSKNHDESPTSNHQKKSRTEPGQGLASCFDYFGHRESGLRERDLGDRMLEKCLLCGHPTFIHGIFIPIMSSEWKIPEGWEIHYGLCTGCCKNPDVTELVENFIAQSQGIIPAVKENNWWKIFFLKPPCHIKEILISVSFPLTHKPKNQNQKNRL